jgi:polar amino acid transport system substrate-binding protein
MKKIIMYLVVLSMIVIPIVNVNSAPEKKKVLKVGTNAEFPPLEYYDSNNKLTGFDVELMQALSKEMDYELEWVDMKFDALLPALSVGKIDAVISGMSATEERKKKVDFTQEYETSPGKSASLLIVKIDNEDIKSVDDLKGKKIVVESGSWQMTYANENFKKSKIVLLGSSQDGIVSFNSGKVDAVFVGYTTGEYYLKNGGSDTAKVVAEIKMPGVAVALQKGNEGLLSEFNKAFAVIKRNGTFKKLAEKYYKK